MPNIQFMFKFPQCLKMSLAVDLFKSKLKYGLCLHLQLTAPPFISPFLYQLVESTI